ncbi:MAG: 3-oxoacyl-ACP reductase FabG [Caldilineaceae bacterium]|nr:3-oxoacyl-ACP reductase FabG [Caldilineaceae bacterium]MDE0182254.1 3-oxoacyl-ACP reductase FabG [Caldilineaceae bacterium]
MTQSRRMEGKRVLVTGSGTGIGRGVALEFAKEGAAVVLHYAHSEAGAASAVEEIRQGGGKAAVFKADLAEIDQVQDLAEQARGFLGGIDVLVNNAGITMNKPFLQVTPEQFDTLYNVNIRGMFFLTQAVAPDMIEQGDGAVVNLTSVHAFAGMTEHTVYAGTKAAIVGFTRVLSLELAQKGVRVNAIAPGWILVENHLKVLGDFDQEAAAGEIPAGVLGAPYDVGKLAVFLASEENRYIVGQTVVIDGGQLAIMPNTGDFRETRQEQWGQGYVAGI